MARYSVTYSLIWEDEDFKGLSSDAKTIFWYLQSNKHGNMIGYYYLPLGYMVTDMKKHNRTKNKTWTEGEIESAFKELLGAKTEERRFVYYDPDAEVLLIPSYLKCHSLKNENQAKGALRALSEVPFSMLGKRFIDCVQTHVKDQYWSMFETVSKLFLNSCETVTQTVSNNSTSTSTSNQSPVPLEGKALPCPYEDIKNLWNKIVAPKGKAEVAKMSDSRKRQLRKIWSEYPKMQNLEAWEEFFKECTTRGFLMKAENSWFTFTWVLEEEHFLKIAEGNYK